LWASDGKLYERVTADGPSTLRTVKLSPEDLNAMSKIPGYPLALPQIEKYTITYVARELVDEVDCYLFQVKPKFLERANALFAGVVWVDVKYLEIVKSYGKFVTDLGDFIRRNCRFQILKRTGKMWKGNTGFRITRGRMTGYTFRMATCRCAW